MILFIYYYYHYYYITIINIKGASHKMSKGLLGCVQTDSTTQQC